MRYSPPTTMQDHTIKYSIGSPIVRYSHDVKRISLDTCYGLKSPKSSPHLALRLAGPGTATRSRNVQPVLSLQPWKEEARGEETEASMIRHEEDGKVDCHRSREEVGDPRWRPRVVDAGCYQHLPDRHDCRRGICCRPSHGPTSRSCCIDDYTCKSLQPGGCSLDEC